MLKCVSADTALGARLGASFVQLRQLYRYSTVTAVLRCRLTCFHSMNSAPSAVEQRASRRAQIVHYFFFRSQGPQGQMRIHSVP